MDLGPGGLVDGDVDYRMSDGRSGEMVLRLERVDVGMDRVRRDERWDDLSGGDENISRRRGL